jgi:hypothetical protein
MGSPPSPPLGALEFAFATEEPAGPKPARGQFARSSQGKEAFGQCRR